MKVAVIGSRNFNDYTTLARVLDGISKFRSIDLIVSGGAKGADYLAEMYANHEQIPKKIFLPDWNKHGKAAGPIRNKEIVNASDLIIAFWDGESRGTKSSIDYAKSIGKECIINLHDS